MFAGTNNSFDVDVVVKNFQSKINNSINDSFNYKIINVNGKLFREWMTNGNKNYYSTYLKILIIMIWFLIIKDIKITSQKHYEQQKLNITKRKFDDVLFSP